MVWMHSPAFFSAKGTRSSLTSSTIESCTSASNLISQLFFLIRLFILMAACSMISLEAPCGSAFKPERKHSDTTPLSTEL